MNVAEPQSVVCLHPELMECKEWPIKPLKIDPGEGRRPLG